MRKILLLFRFGGIIKVFGGEIMRIFKNELFFSNDFISASRKRFSGSMEPHGHNFFEIEFVISGSGSYIIDGKKYDIKPNAVFFMTPANVHYIEASDMEIINVMFRSNGEILPFDVLFRMPSFFALNESDGALVSGMLSELLAVYKDDSDYGSLLLKCVCKKLAAFISPEKETTKTYVSEAMAYVLENFRYGISLESVAKKVGVSRAYLSDSFLKQTGTNFSTYLDDLRFSYAITLLDSTDMSITDVCLSSGFADYSNFLRRFKKRYGVTPKKYRNVKKLRLQKQP